jgi:hypothetical protein
MREIKVHGAFSVPFIQFQFNNHEKYTFPNLEKIDRKPEDWVASVNTSFPQITNNDPHISPIFRDNLKKDLMYDIKTIFRDLDIKNDFVMDQFWYNVYHEHQGQEPHDHLSDCTGKSPFWSMIYYNRGTTPTCFIRSDSLYRTQEFPEWLETKVNQCFVNEYVPEITEGDIILFPPYIKHFVRHHGDEMRVTFASNLLLK